MCLLWGPEGSQYTDPEVKDVIASEDDLEAADSGADQNGLRFSSRVWVSRFIFESLVVISE